MIFGKAPTTNCTGSRSGRRSFFDETVGLHLESLETELAALQSEAETLAGEIEELTGEGDDLGVASGRKPGLGGDGMR